MVFLIAGENVGHERALTREETNRDVQSLSVPKLGLSLPQLRIHSIVVVFHLKQKS
jgi:hypothetical protein